MARRDLHAIFQPRLLEERLNQRLHACILHQNIIDKTRGHLRRWLFCQDFSRTANGRQRAFQFVGQRVNVVFNIIFAFEANAHVFQRLCELTQFATSRIGQRQWSIRRHRIGITRQRTD
ncbi:hypothetical protein D3C80_1165180 [compost metagenome]